MKIPDTIELLKIDGVAVLRCTEGQARGYIFKQGGQVVKMKRAGGVAVAVVASGGVAVYKQAHYATLHAVQMAENRAVAYRNSLMARLGRDELVACTDMENIAENMAEYIGTLE